jgi:hypothetical protein|tara:strand:+ start:186 stop:446 length:261 start_codon:yes stop_codon:yes gene_type:complete
MYRVTAHLENVQKVDAVMGRKKNDKGKWVNETKRKIFNTVSQICKTKADCDKIISEWRSKYTIAKGKNGKKMHKYGKELINISFVN